MGLNVSDKRVNNFSASFNSILSFFTRLNKRFFLTSEPFSLINNLRLAFATGIKSELISTESLKRILKRLSNLSI